MAYNPTFPQFGTSQGLVDPTLNKQVIDQEERDRIKKAKAECKAQGGTWNEATQSCDLPLDKQKINPKIIEGIVSGEQSKEQTQQNVKLTAPEYIRDEETGAIKGIKLPDGRTFLGINKKEIDALASNYMSKTTPPEGTVPAGTARTTAERQAQIQRLTELAQQGLLTPEELQQIEGASTDWGQALGAGVAGVIPGLLGGAAAGAIAGAPIAGVGAIPGAIGGAIVGGLGTFLTSMRSNIKSQQTGQFSADTTALTKGERMLRSLITDTNQNPQNAAENIALFYHTLNLIDAAHAKTWKDSQENLNVFLGNDGTPQLAKFNTFDATMRLYYTSQFETALAQPDATRVLITAEDLGADIE